MMRVLLLVMLLARAPFLAAAEPPPAGAAASTKPADVAKKDAAPAPLSPELAAKAGAASPLVLLLYDPSVRQELKLTAEQTTAIDAALSDVAGPLWHARDLKDAPTDQGRVRVYDHLRQALSAKLEPQQLQRLDGLLLRGQGWKVIRLSQFQQELALSNDQLQRIDRLLAIATGENGQLTEQQDAAVIRVLTKKQQSTLSRLLGAEFQLPSSWRYCRAPGFPEITTWINTEPLDVDSLRGKVVVVHFWAFGCINCIHNIPHYEAWFQKYRERDVVIVGIHTPETATEREVESVRTKVAENKMQYPIAIDGASATWNAWANAWWPSVYLVDKHGYVRYWWYGELNWKDAKGEALMRSRIDRLLTED